MNYSDNTKYSANPEGTRINAFQGTRPYLIFLAAVVAVSLFIVVRGITMTLFYAELMERGVVTRAVVVSDELRPGSRHRGMVRYIGYAYADSAGRVYTGTATLKSVTDAGIDEVTYLPDEPVRQVPFRMSPERVYQPVKDAGLFAFAAVAITILLGLGMKRFMGRRTD